MSAWSRGGTLHRGSGKEAGDLLLFLRRKSIKFAAKHLKNLLRGTVRLPDPIVKIFPIDRNPHVPQSFQLDVYLFKAAFIATCPSPSKVGKETHYDAYFGLEYLLFFCFQYSLIDGDTPFLFSVGQISLAPCTNVESVFILIDDPIIQRFAQTCRIKRFRDIFPNPADGIEMFGFADSRKFLYAAIPYNQGIPIKDISHSTMLYDKVTANACSSFFY
ncbi:MULTISPECIES: hypothetical protein [Akkermansia]|jgi:hypothetical protein|uniref:hypothetical protein n=2 Tax=Akkermansiaceae TaxID=1647988 RepID=UPI000C9C41DC|nr:MULTISPECIES: hypothetical protein [Akkermansia]PNC33392.1 hypothetical protein CXU12_12545 [Akkermansia muciniphila]MBS6840345.1 hypothetical protein [Akkermansia sp.]MCC8041465.1 hypothetical protein [Akkermansia sp.]MEE0534175.1 hypothetical protein [Akkermansia sp.]PNC61353.1 hypothetical protein CXU13_01740 [Akkermansia muciniphila]